MKNFNCLLFITLFSVLSFFPSSGRAVVFSETGIRENLAAWQWTGLGTVDIFLSELGLQKGDDIDALSLGDDPMICSDSRYDVFVVDDSDKGTTGDVKLRADANIPIGRDVYREDRNSKKNVLCIPDLFAKSGVTPATGQIDAFDFGDKKLIPQDYLYFSLTPGSPTLADHGWGAGDILVYKYQNSSFLKRYATAADIGTPVNIDAVSIHDHHQNDSYDKTVDYIIYSSGDSNVYHYGYGAPGSPAVHTHSGFGLDNSDNIRSLEHMTNYCAAENLVAGDINKDQKLDLIDLIAGFQMLSGMIIAPDEKESLEDAVNLAIFSVVDQQGLMDKSAVIKKIIDFMGLVEAQQAQFLKSTELIDYLLNTFVFPCGTIELEGTHTIVFHFSSEAECAGITGTVKLTPELSEDNMIYHIAYDDVVVENCTVNGKASTEITIGASTITVTHDFEEMSLCDQNLDGSMTIVYDKDTGAITSISKQSQNSYSIDGEVITTKTDVTYNGSSLSGSLEISTGGMDYICQFDKLIYDETGISGGITLTIDDKVYECELNDVQIDEECGIPNSGTMTVNGIELDFSETDCENPEVAVTIHGRTVTLSLSEVKKLLMN